MRRSTSPRGQSFALNDTTSYQGRWGIKRAMYIAQVGGAPINAAVVRVHRAHAHMCRPTHCVRSPPTHTQYLLTKTGPVTTCGLEGTAFYKTGLREDRDAPDGQVHFVPFAPL